MSRDPSPFPSQAQVQRWAKHYRTELAASSSTIASTFLAVSALARALDPRSITDSIHSFPLRASRYVSKGSSPAFRPQRPS